MRSCRMHQAVERPNSVDNCSKHVRDRVAIAQVEWHHEMPVAVELVTNTAQHLSTPRYQNDRCPVLRRMERDASTDS